MAEPKSKKWVDFQELKECVTFAQVLDRLELMTGLERAGDKLRGQCPICKRGDEKSKSFSVNVSKQVFQCFACKRRGNVLDFTAAVRDTDVHRAALWLRDQFLAAAVVTGEATPAAAVETADRDASLPVDYAPGANEIPQGNTAWTARERWLAQVIARGVARYLVEALAPLQDVEAVAAGMLGRMEMPEEGLGAADGDGNHADPMP